MLHEQKGEKEMKFRVKETEDSYKPIINENGNEIATVWSAYSGDAESTATLFAAAPELLEALEGVIHEWKQRPECILTAKTYRKAIVAIARAKGE